MDRQRAGKLPQWVWVLIIGAGLWLITAAAAIATGNLIIAPEVLLLGGFVVPTALLFWILGQLPPGESEHRTALDAPRVLAAFALGGGLGLLASAVIEDYWTAAWPRVFYFDVALTEEVVKFAAVWLLALPLAFYLRRDGMLLGVAVGLGFSAFESTGYAFNVLLVDRVVDVDLLATQALRGVLTPTGHALWTALVAGALFAGARGARLRMTWNVAGWLAAVLALHVAWDVSRGLAAATLLLADGGSVTRDVVLGTGYRSLAATYGSAIEVGSAVLQVLIAAVGVALFVRYWRLAGSTVEGATVTAADPAAARLEDGHG